MNLRLFLVALLVVMPGTHFPATLFFGPEPAHLEAKVTALIEKAQQRLWVAMYRLTSAPCVKAVVAAKDRGVDVRVVVDRQQLLLPAHAVVRRRLGEGGIVCEVGGRLGRLMHHKWAVIDNILVTGSANWTRAGLNSNREVCAVIDDPAIVQGYVTHFMTLTSRAAGLAVASPPVSADFFFIPDHRAAMRRWLSDAIDKARDRICITMYSLTAGWVWKCLVSAVRRGVCVSVIVDSEQMKQYERFPSAVRVKRWNSDVQGTLHEKCLLIDDALWLGSMNVTGAGMMYNEENVVRLVGGGAPTVFAAHFDRLFASIK